MTNANQPAAARNSQSTGAETKSADSKVPYEKTASDLKKEAANVSPFSVSVGHVYDGPLDLLLDLIRKQDIDIYDIPSPRSPRSSSPMSRG